MFLHPILRGFDPILRGFVPILRWFDPILRGFVPNLTLRGVVSPINLLLDFNQLLADN